MAKSKKQQMESTKAAKVVQLPISVVHTGNEHLVYANFFSVNHTPFEFTLDFATVTPDALVRYTKGDRKESLQISPTIRIFVPADIIAAMIDALRENLSKFELKYGPAKRPGVVVGQREAKDANRE